MAKNTSNEVTTRWNEKNYGKIHMDIPKEVFEKFRTTCEKNGDTMNSVVWKGIENFIENE